MDKRSIQRLMTSAGYYNGDIDGDFGPKTEQGANKILERHLKSLPAGSTRWGITRKIIAACQIILIHAGLEEEVGKIDGFWGPSTEYAPR